MARFFALPALLLSISAQAASPAPVAGEASPSVYAPGDVPLNEDDLRAITLQVIQKNPLVSSASGIKFASAQHADRTTDLASIVYFPHTESSGVKQAFQVRCLRHAPDKSWSCENPRIRRYLRLDSQDYEVRVTGSISTEGALAAIEASREVARAISPASAPVPDTVVMVLPDSNGTYLVSWGTPDGNQLLYVRARLRGDANPARPESWETSAFEPIEPGH